MKVTRKKIRARRTENNKTIVDAYKKYKRYGGKIDKDLFSNIVKSFGKYATEKLFDGEVIKFPKKLGKFAIVGRKPNMSKGYYNKKYKLPPDWKKNKNLSELDNDGKYINTMYHLNNHSNGIIYKCKWYKTNNTNLFKRLYYFKLTMPNKRLLAKKIFAGSKYILNNGAKL